jgi:hypothetical protein
VTAASSRQPDYGCCCQSFKETRETEDGDLVCAIGIRIIWERAIPRRRPNRLRILLRLWFLAGIGKFIPCGKRRQAASGNCHDGTQQAPMRWWPLDPTLTVMRLPWVQVRTSGEEPDGDRETHASSTLSSAPVDFFWAFFQLSFHFFRAFLTTAWAGLSISSPFSPSVFSGLLASKLC